MPSRSWAMRIADLFRKRSRPLLLRGRFCPYLETLEDRTLLTGALSITPITWDIIGLDSNKPASEGPDAFLVGARVTNTSSVTVTNVTASFNFGTYGGATPSNSSPYIHIATGASTTLLVASLAPG